jgi:hypothetical protein
MENLQEEFFHGYQDVYYSGGTSQYASIGKSNIEFEAKIFEDLVSTLETGGGINGAPAGHPKSTEYKLWIEQELANNYSSYPTQINLDKYFYFLEAFKESYPEYNYPTRSDLYPDALINLTKSKKCN